MSIGFALGPSTNKWIGRAVNLNSPASFEGTYTAIGAGGAAVAVTRDRRCSIEEFKWRDLATRRPKVGVEVSAAMGGVTVRLK